MTAPRTPHDGPAPPLAILAELTHRCPLQCPYCANPLELERAAGELDTETWARVLDEAAALGALQVHFSGGEPSVRKDLVSLTAHAARAGLYTNLITSGVLLDRARLEALATAGLDHVQLSIQDSEPGNADRIGGFAGGHERKMAFAQWVRAAGLPLTVNAPVHRQNLDHLDDIIDLAANLGARRLEVAHVQYYGWAYRNRAALMPTRAQLDRATETVERARARQKGTMAFDYVVPDYYARRPKACMGGWARQFLNITPMGKVLPCHAAESIPGLGFESALDRSLAEIWRDS
ncbi:MAG: pyrroloquinoline quinone biosynthesis protein PqqE, partial [Kiloniellaceae bacterium]